MVEASVRGLPEAQSGESFLSCPYPSDNQVNPERGDARNFFAPGAGGDDMYFPMQTSAVTRNAFTIPYMTQESTGTDAGTDASTDVGTDIGSDVGDFGGGGDAGSSDVDWGSMDWGTTSDGGGDDVQPVCGDDVPCD
jgi:hypothetical protein